MLLIEIVCPDSYFSFQILTKEALRQLSLYTKTNEHFQCYYRTGNEPIFKKNQSLAKTINYLFWPLLCIATCWMIFIICCTRWLVNRVGERSGHDLRLHQFQLACEEGNVEKLSKYLVSRHMKTPLDEKCNLKHFRRHPTVDINDKNEMNVASLRCAISGRKNTLTSKSHLECIELLLIHGANIQGVAISQKDNRPDSLSTTVIYLCSKKPHLKWYALSLTRLLIAAGHQFNELGENYLLHLLLTEAICNESEQNSEEQFMRKWGIEIFSKQSLMDGLEKVHIDVNDLEPKYKERATDFIEFISASSKEIDTLQQMSRKKIRKYLLELQPNRNLYFLVTQIPLPINMITFLLFDFKPPKLSYYDYSAIYFEESVV